MSQLINTPTPPYYAVIFTSILSSDDADYHAMADRMIEQVAQQEGFLGFESARDDVGITVSYWEDEAAIRRWKDDVEHQTAQQQGKSRWYDAYTIRIAKVEREYRFERTAP